MIIYNYQNMKIEQFELRPKTPIRPVGYMENPFIGNDGKDYHSTDALRTANEAHFQQTHYYKSSVLGREYLPTTEGYAQMKQDERAHWDAQIIDVNRGKILEPIKPFPKLT